MAKNSDSIFNLRQWNVEEVISEKTSTALGSVRQTIRLLNQDCTIPFIARYRQDQTGGLTAEKLREIQEVHESIETVNKKVESIVKTLIKEEPSSTSLISDLVNAKTLNEVEFLNASCKKTGSKQTLVERARQLGLEEAALLFLNSSNKLPCLKHFVQPGTKGLSSEEDIFLGWQHIIADEIAKNRKVMEYSDKKIQYSDVRICSCLSEMAKKKDKQAFVEGHTTNNFKFENYFDFSLSVKTVKPHQIMAINRGEHLKILTVKIEIPTATFDDIFEFCKNNWNVSLLNEFGQKLLEQAIKDALNRLLLPFFKRHTRSELTKMAVKASISVFQQNLKNLLLRPPVRGNVVLGIDPGFMHGCKLAMVSKSGELLETKLINITSKPGINSLQAKVLSKFVIKHNCNLIALGNGTASRETEHFLSELIKNDMFFPNDVKYVTISEGGASVYSVSTEADAEFPNLSPNFRSAVSIARRLQDPLLEFSKVEPKHLGVGMYQHDIPDSQISKALDKILVECVSFVGVDINLCPEFILKKIAGLNSAKAQSIIEWRTKKGPFLNREQLNLVKGIGPKSYEQCSGFIKIYPQTFASDNGKEKENEVPASQSRKRKMASSSCSKNNKKAKLEVNALDATIIHPESYTIVDKLLDHLNLSSDDIGSEIFINRIKSCNDKITDFGATNTIPQCTLNLIVEALNQPLNYDLRSEFDLPLFVSGIHSITDLKVGSAVTGQVQNTTHFGAFVDIGVGKNGLIHNSRLQSKTLIVGQRVDVEILSVDASKGRIGLRLL